MTEKFPGYDVLAKRETVSWDDATREVIDARLTVSAEPRFFTAPEWRTLSAICDRIMPQSSTRAPVPLAAYVDEKMSEDRTDGFRYADLPDQGSAWRLGLAALEAAAQSAHQVAFDALPAADQDALLTRMQAGELTGKAWGEMPCRSFFEHRLIPDIVHAYYAHPTAWSEIGFGGPASPRGYVRMGLDRRDPWEPAEARPGDDGAARRKNRHVG